MPFGLSTASFPMQVLLGLYLGLLTGVVPALVCFGFGFVFKYVTGLTIPALGVVVLGIAIAGINGGLMAFNDATVVQSSNSVALVTALVVVLLGCFYAHAKGDALGASLPKHFSLKRLRELPKHFSLKRLRERTLSKDVVDFVGGFGQVRVPIVGTVGDMEAYPPLPETLRIDIAAVDWTFPADLPLSELERRFEERLRAEFDVADADVHIDERARATVTVAPPLSGVSKRVARGERAVSVTALVPTGVARGDAVTLHTDAGDCTGTIVAAKTGPEVGADESGADATPATDGGTGEAPAAHAAGHAPVTTGGEGRVTVATDRASAETLLGASEGSIVVTARGTRREFELLSLLRRTGNRVRRLTVRADGPLDGTTLGEADVRDVYGVAVIALRHDGSWTVAPRGDTAVSGGDDCFAVGTRETLNAFEEAVA
ncbi:LOW QUALITY PROTEIN: hypotheical protein [Halarchaeum acidiphilum MH1-52-1]|uniref:Hypotheical protein n=1 Tax=Halarchaeum acidiphilum MH1-52-1 TaxID=1261545 RepID=U2YWV0_9EURY|nr:LOW QUALITY PROTEIN: hypotheical protein [Halarchaeum acidiphilum MH1-52-1]